MDNRPRIWVFLVALVFAVGNASATPIAPSQIIAFGDSLSDGGNAAALILANIPEGQQGNPAVLQQAYAGIPFPEGATSFVPSAPYLLTDNPLEARFSNGPVWVERLAHALGVPLNPAALGGTNFAFGGADSGPLPGVPTDPIPSLVTQVDMYLGGLQAAGAPLDQGALFVVFGGGNDLRALGQVTTAAAEAAFIASLQETGDLAGAVAAGDAAATAAFEAVIAGGGSIADALAAGEAAGQQAFIGVLIATGDTITAQLALQAAAAQAAQDLVAASATNLLGVIDTLLQAGAINFLIPLVPDVSLGPDSGRLDPETRALVSALSFGLNQLLLQNLDPLLANPDLNINILDTFSLFTDVALRPAAYGLANADAACITTAVCDDPSKYLFWDGIHPTSAGHQILADAAIGLIRVPEPDSLVLMGLGLLIVGWAIRRKLP